MALPVPPITSTSAPNSTRSSAVERSPCEAVMWRALSEASSKRFRSCLCRWRFRVRISAYWLVDRFSGSGVIMGELSSAGSGFAGGMRTAFLAARSLITFASPCRTAYGKEGRRCEMIFVFFFPFIPFIPFHHISANRTCIGMTTWCIIAPLFSTHASTRSGDP